MTPDATELRVVGEIEELVRLTELTDVQFVRVSGERRETRDEQFADHHPEIRVFHRANPAGLEVRCVVVVDTEEGRLLSDVAVQFTHGEPLEVDDSVLEEFTQRVGVMAAYPYLRECIHLTAARLRIAPPILRLLKAEEAQLEIDEHGPATPGGIPTSGRPTQDA